MRVRAILICTMLTLLAIASVSAAAIAQEDDFNPPMPPSLPSTGGSGGGGGSGGSYTPEPFKEYTVNLTSSDGSPMGSVMVKGYSLASVIASVSLGNGNESVLVGLSADLSSVPSNIGLDIFRIDASGITLPLDADRFSSFLAFNLTRHAGGEWPMISGTVRLTIRVPESALNGFDRGSKFYLVKDEGTRYVVYEAVPGIAGGMAEFDVPLLYEPGSPSATGIFTLAGTKIKVANASTTMVTPTPAPATSTPKSGDSFASLMGLMAALAVAAVLYSRGKKR